MMKAMMTAVLCLAATLGWGEEGAAAKDAVVFVSAHPDDMTAAIGFCLLAKDTFDLHVIDYTHGERGCGQEKFTNGWTKVTRTKEEESVCRAIGAKLHWLDEIDGEAHAGRETCERLAALLKELKPRAVIGHWPVDIHTDHVMAGAALLRAVFLSGLKPEVYFFEEYYQDKHFPVDFTVDVSSVWDRKLEITRLYACQNPNNGLVDGVAAASQFRGWNSANFYAGKAEAFAALYPQLQGTKTIFAELPRPDVQLPPFEGAK